MKNLKTLLLIAVFTLGSSAIANAQKVGHIDFEKLVAEMPETKTLKLDMEKLGKTYQDEIKGGLSIFSLSKIASSFSKKIVTASLIKTPIARARR